MNGRGRCVSSAGRCSCSTELAGFLSCRIEQAMFTEPADQSVWWYHHFLLTWAEEGAASCDMDRYENLLRAEAVTLEELIEVEDRCKVCLCV